MRIGTISKCVNVNRRKVEVFLEMQLSVRNAAQRSAHLILAERPLNDQSTAHPHNHLPSTEKGTELAWEEEMLIQAGNCRSWKAEE